VTIGSRSVADLLAASVDAVLAVEPEPAARVYAHLFAAHPELEAQFLMDRTGAVRREMLNVALATLLGLVEGVSYAPAMLRAERTNHDGWGVPPEQFSAFFDAVHAAFRDLAADAWPEGADTAWVSAIRRAREAAA
jgi:hemoglobin-like flavoprotein